MFEYAQFNDMCYNEISDAAKIYISVAKNMCLLTLLTCYTVLHIHTLQSIFYLTHISNDLLIYYIDNSENNI